MTGRRVLVTGAGGFLGGHVVGALRTAGCTVVTSAQRKRPGIDHAADLLDPAAVHRLLRVSAPDSVVHLAGATGAHVDLDDLIAANVVVTDHVLAAVEAKARGAVTVVAGSSAVYAPTAAPIDEGSPVGPVTPYGRSKAAQERSAEAAGSRGLRVLVLRLFNLVGPGQPAGLLLSDLVRRVVVAESDPTLPRELVVGRLDSRRDFVDVRDAAAALCAVVVGNVGGGPFNVASGRATSVVELAQLVLEIAGAPLTVRSTGSAAHTDVDVQQGSSARLTAATGWRPAIPLRESVADLLVHVRREAGG